MNNAQIKSVWDFEGMTMSIYSKLPITEKARLLEKHGFIHRPWYLKSIPNFYRFVWIPWFRFTQWYRWRFGQSRQNLIIHYKLNEAKKIHEKKWGIVIP